jgi:aryl-alcohol dehydrogenase-like predicted oxidoreductase
MAERTAVTAAAAGTVDIGGDITVNRLGCGAMRLTGPGVWGPPPNPAEALAVLRRAVELQVNFIDTADSYGPEVSERLIAEALYPYPDDLVIATKGGMVRPGPDEWVPNGRPEHLRAACESSLRRLRLEQIPLYQLHRPDPRVPFDESVGALVTLKDEGKIRHIGLSNVTDEQIDQAERLTPIVSVQNRYNMLDRESDPIVDRCAWQDMTFIPWAPVREAGESQAALIIAERHHATPTQVMLAWLLARAPVMLPIPGTASVSHLEENVGAAGLELGPDELAALNQNR